MEFKALFGIHRPRPSAGNYRSATQDEASGLRRFLFRFRTKQALQAGHSGRGDATRVKLLVQPNEIV